MLPGINRIYTLLTEHALERKEKRYPAGSVKEKARDF